MNRPHAESCEQNRRPILAVLQRHLDEQCERLLEIGSGTGQHAVYFAPAFPWLIWQPSDRADNLPAIEAWMAAEPSPNIAPPLRLDVLHDPWPSGPFDAVFSANTAHIMSEAAVEAMFRGVGGVLRGGGLFLLYGPFAVGGRHTAPSNTRFDAWLKAQDPAMGVRDLDWLNGLARGAGLDEAEVIDMPADNKVLCFRRNG